MNLAGWSFEQPLWLLGLPMVVWPWWRQPLVPRWPVAWLALVPPDPLSDALDHLRRLAAALAIGAAWLSLAGPAQTEQVVQRVGHGAEIVLVLDRSRSMDAEPRLGAADPGGGRRGFADESKVAAARRLVSAFVAGRPQDAIGMVWFSTEALPFLPFTQNATVIQAALAAATVGKGLGDTDIGRALQVAARYFDDRPYQGSRLLLLISDGGARLDAATRDDLARRLRQQHIGVSWLYLLGSRGRPLQPDEALSEAEAEALPEQSLHRYLRGIGVPYRVYQADDPQALQDALADVGRLEQHALRFTDRLPRRDRMPLTLAIALTGLAVWLLLQAALVGHRP